MEEDVLDLTCARAFQGGRELCAKMVLFYPPPPKYTRVQEPSTR